MPAHHFPKLITALIAFITTLIIASFSNASTLSYSITELPAGINPNSINNLGHIVGTIQIPSSKPDEYIFHAVLYKDGKTIDLGTLGGENSIAGDINDSDLIVGRSDTKNRQSHAFFYGKGKMNDLGTLPKHTASSAFGVNNAGQIVGNSSRRNHSFDSHAFIYAKGKMTDIGTLGGEISFVGGINDAGQVVGGAQMKNGYDSVFLYKNGKMTNLGAPPPPRGQITGGIYINNSGIVIAGLGDRYGTGYIYENRKWTEVGKLPNSLRNSTVEAINSSGAIVGAGFVTTSKDKYARHAYVRSNGKSKDLNNLISKKSGWVLEEAKDINDKRLIIGRGKHNGKDSTYLLTPNSEKK